MSKSTFQDKIRATEAYKEVEEMDRVDRLLRQEGVIK